MITVSNVLEQQLRAVDPMRGKVLSLAFADHVIKVCADELTPEQQDLSRIYLRTAQALFSGSASMTALADASGAHGKIRLAGSRLAEEILWVAVLAVSVCWQRDLVREGLSQGELKNLTVRTVAAEGQTVVRRCTGGLEALWQLTHVISTADRVDSQLMTNLLDELEEEESLKVDFARHVLETRPGEGYFSAVLDDPSRLPLAVVARQAQHMLGEEEARWQLTRLVETLAERPNQRPSDQLQPGGPSSRQRSFPRRSVKDES